MAISKLDLINLALSRVRVEPLSSLDEGTQTALVVDAIYDQTREYVLGAANWNFALRRATLAKLSKDPAFGFTYAFALPSNYIRVTSVHLSTSDYAEGPEYRLENMLIDGTDTNVIMCDYNPLYLRYVANITDVNTMTVGFRNTLAWALAMELAAAIPAKVTLFDKCQEMYQKTKMIAASRDAVEDYPESRPNGSWYNSRRGNRIGDTGGGW